jgi:DNA-binding HxlR family transcriptional regulator
VSTLGNVSDCPVDISLKYLGKKWTFHIIRDLFLGVMRFKAFLDENPDLSGKVLAERLAELRENGIVEKIVTDTFPITIEYHLTDKGRALNKVIYELAVFAIKTCPEFKKNIKDDACSIEKFKLFKKALNIKV